MTSSELPKTIEEAKILLRSGASMAPLSVIALSLAQQYNDRTALQIFRELVDTVMSIERFDEPEVPK